MSNDLTDQLTRIIEWISGLGFALPFAIFLLFQLFSRGKKDAASGERAERPPQPNPVEQTAPEPVPEMPFGLPAWLGLDQPVPAPTSEPSVPASDSQWGHNFDRQATTNNWGDSEDWGHGYDQLSEAEDDVLRWGSAFESDAEGEPIRWTSAFDEPGQRNVYGWKSATWGGTFPPRDSEPVVHYG